MKNKLIKRLAVYMAFFQLFSSGIAKGEKTNYKVVSNGSILIQVNDNEDNPIYQKLDTSTNELSNISIFDERNKSTHQYGANQVVFNSHYHRLITDKEIWNEMQSIFPWQEFETKEYAVLFYEYYFDAISECGCGYAAATNYVFRMFEGREEDFYNTFRYPMYNVKAQYVDFNYESDNFLTTLLNHLIILIVSKIMS